MLKAPDESIKDETVVGGRFPQPLCQLRRNFTRFARKVAPPTLTLTLTPLKTIVPTKSSISNKAIIAVPKLHKTATNAAKKIKSNNTIHKKIINT